MEAANVRERPVYLLPPEGDVFGQSRQLRVGQRFSILEGAAL